MTKLFSIKSLACAGAAAFALTLAAAPQADAAPIILTPKVDYTTGTLNVEANNGTEDTKTADKYVVKTADGYSIFLGSGKSSVNLKYELVPASKASTANELTTASKGFNFDISKLLGKETTVGIALNQAGTLAPASIKLTAAPKLKAKLSGDDIKITVDNKEIDKGLVDKDFTGYTYEYKVGTYGKWTGAQESANTPDTAENKKDQPLEDAIKASKNLGTTIYLRVAKSDKTKAANPSQYQTSPWSNEVKVKVPAKAKAPKISIKTAEMTKAFEWKMASKLEYRVTVNGKTSAWTKSIGAADWNRLISAAAETAFDSVKDADVTSKIAAADVANLVKGDAISDNVTIQVRTAATEKKDASKIYILDLNASQASPTKDEIKVVAAQSSKKGATASAAAISTADLPDGMDAQYSVDNGKSWKKIKGEVHLEFDKMNNGTIALRCVGNNKKKLVLPSAVTTVTIPTNGSTGKITAKAYEINTKKWKEVSYTDYVNKTPATP